jgi:hypothetical protein
MDKLKSTPPSRSRWQPSAPLWQRAPNKLANGAALADLMMLIPHLKRHSDAQLNHLQRQLEEVFITFDKKIVFTDINLKLKAYRHETRDQITYP